MASTADSNRRLVNSWPLSQLEPTTNQVSGEAPNSASARYRIALTDSAVRGRARSRSPAGQDGVRIASWLSAEQKANNSAGSRIRKRTEQTLNWTLNRVNPAQYPGFNFCRSLQMCFRRRERRRDHEVVAVHAVVAVVVLHTPGPDLPRLPVYSTRAITINRAMCASGATTMDVAASEMDAMPG
jgi:hypothetical protein